MKILYNTTNGGLAQLGEHLPYKQGVGGSIPSTSTSGLLEKRLNSHAFHACIHGFESRTGHHFIF